MNVGVELEDIRVSLDQLMLDPNNYRLAYKGIEPVTSDDQVESLQNELEKKLSKEQLNDLMESILVNGFLDVDRIVVRKLKGSENKYVVIEGNRRTAALKSLYRDHIDGYIVLSDSLLDKMSSLSVVLIDAISSEKIDEQFKTLMGIRHVSGPKQWTGVQRAKLVDDLFKLGKPANEVGKLLGISGIEANRRRNGYLAYLQMASDSKYGEYIQPKHYALLLEFVSNKYAREWFGWKDGKQFASKSKRRILYRHIVKLNDATSAEINNPTEARSFCKTIVNESVSSQIEKGYCSVISLTNKLRRGLELLRVLIIHQT
ncbi:ParB N-terminal domain-containing protein [Pseudoalteromonas luteoviolacea]|uniref:ParB N-terminal domain-containing protein n=1 Tax=Pseudoalteromonas luteoviolacea TaxID=43657 RepID=UPI00068F9F7C|nr:ParB N-terminal domain-containing protein [Pseudoalteromonas luteoviolacea]